MINILRHIPQNSTPSLVFRDCINKFCGSKFKPNRPLDSPFTILYLNKYYKQGKPQKPLPWLLFIAPAIAMAAYNHNFGWSTTNSLIFTGLFVVGSAWRLFSGFRTNIKIMSLIVDPQFKHCYLTVRFKANMLQLAKYYAVLPGKDQKFYDFYDQLKGHTYSSNKPEKLSREDQAKLMADVKDFLNLKIPMDKVEFSEMYSKMQKQGIKNLKPTPDTLNIFMEVKAPSQQKNTSFNKFPLDLPLNQNAYKENEDILLALAEGKQIQTTPIEEVKTQNEVKQQKQGKQQKQYKSD